jgi:carbonic anhydrase
MDVIERLFSNNRKWAERITRADPDFFLKLSRQQSPRYLWVGCSDSRVPANEIVGLPPGELFVHRNVANIVSHTDLNFLSVLQYAVQILHVDHIIVCGHYGCGGVLTALRTENNGLIDNWLRSIKELFERNKASILERGPEERANYLCELNVLRQVHNIARTSIVQEAWAAGERLAIHGWVYDIRDGILKDLDATLTGKEAAPEIYHLQP